MAILWCGGEDVDFTTQGAVVAFTTANTFRSAYSRASLGYTTLGTGVPGVFQAFPGGAVTSAWFRCYVRMDSLITSMRGIGVGLSGSTKGLVIGSSAASSSKWALAKYDGTTRTQLATESGTSIATNTLYKIDMQIVSYGASATVNVFVDNVQLITFSGDVTVTGMTNFDCVIIYVEGSQTSRWSEIIVSSTDTRGILGLATLALTGAGTTTNWTNNTFSNINGTTLSDANPTSINTTATEQQYNVTDVANPIYTVRAVRIAARLANSVGSTPTQVKLGYNSGGSVAFGTGNAKTTTSAYVNYQQLDLTNPVTSADFVSSEMNALQLELKSA